MPRTKQFDETEILQKATELFWKQGFANTSVNDLVANLGINRASLYGTFGDKEKLFYKSFSAYVAQNTAAVKAFLLQEPNVKEGFRKLFEMNIQQSVKDPDRKGCLVVNTATEAIPGDPQMHKVIADSKSAIEKVFANYIKSGIEQGQISNSKDPKTLASLMFMLYSGMMVSAKIDPKPSMLRKSMEEALGLLD